MKNLIQKIDEDREEMTSLLIKWSNINSGTENIQGLALMLQALKSSFKKLQGEMHEIPLPPKKKIDSNGKIIETPLGKALLIQKHSDAPIKVFLGGHMDVALAPHQPFFECKQIDSNTLHGLGVADMKGGLVILLKALETLENSPLAGKIGWTVLINPDEEIGSPGSAPLFTQFAKDHRFGLIFEPSLPDGNLVSARKGSLTYTAIARGKSAHAGRDFHLGKNALTAIARFAIASDALTYEEKGTTVNIGKIEGGGPTNIVPDLGICRLNIRSKSPQGMQEVQEKLQQLAQEMNIELFLDNIKPVKAFDEKTEALFHRLYKHGEKFGYHLSWKESGGVCDGNTLAAAGIPTIDTLGIVGGGLHTTDEYAHIDSLTERAKWAASLLFEEAGWTL